MIVNPTIVLVLGICFCARTIASNTTLDEAIRKQEEADSIHPEHVLSRKRRYLVFPEGSSLQVVFCLTAGTYVGIADIFYMGATASLAWQLPEDPYIPYRHKADPLHRIDQANTILKDKIDISRLKPTIGKNILINKYTGEPIQPFVKNQYSKKYEWIVQQGKKTNPHRRKKILANPAFAKRSIGSNETESKKTKRATVMKIDRKAMHRAQEDRMYLDPEQMNRNSIQFHRHTRSQLYEKIERMLRGMGSDGRHCVLKALCEIGQDSDKSQGTFLDEIMKAIFTLPIGERFDSKHYQMYDEAHRTKKNCAEEFSNCVSSIKTIPLR